MKASSVAMAHGVADWGGGISATAVGHDATAGTSASLTASRSSTTILRPMNANDC